MHSHLVLPDFIIILLLLVFFFIHLPFSSRRLKLYPGIIWDKFSRVMKLSWEGSLSLQCNLSTLIQQHFQLVMLPFNCNCLLLQTLRECHTCYLIIMVHLLIGFTIPRNSIVKNKREISRRVSCVVVFIKLHRCWRNCSNEQYSKNVKWPSARIKVKNTFALFVCIKDTNTYI